MKNRESRIPPSPKATAGRGKNQKSGVTARHIYKSFVLRRVVVAVTVFGILVSQGVLIKPIPKAEAAIIPPGVCEAYAWAIDKLKGLVPKPGNIDLEGKFGSYINLNAVPVVDTTVKGAVEKEVQASRANDRKMDCENFLKKILLSTLKKRLLDKIVDQTVRWIQNKEEPRFVTDFDSFLREAGKEAVGSVVQDLGGDFLCKPYSLNVRLSLLPVKTFTQRASCTLDDIVGNFQNFYRNFESGGWIGYQELWMPQNNLIGASLMAQEEALKRAAEEQQAAMNEMYASQGFIGVKRCKPGGWAFVDTIQKKVVIQVSDGVNIYPITPGPVEMQLNQAMRPRSPYTVSITTVPPPGVPSTVSLFGYEWQCIDVETVTPGKVVGEAATDVLTKTGIDYIINADDLTEYITALADAAINRLTKETVAGLKNMFTGQQGSSPRGAVGTYNCDELKNVDPATGALIPTPASDACEEYGGVVQSVNTQAFENLKAMLQDAKTSAQEALQYFQVAKTLNEQLINALSDLMICQYQKAVILDPNASTTLEAATSSIPIFDRALVDIPILITDIDATLAILTPQLAAQPTTNQKVLDFRTQSTRFESNGAQFVSLINSALTTTGGYLTQCRALP